MELLKVKDLKTYFYTYRGVVKALNGVELDILDGEVVGLVGETGCGKSVTARSIMRLIDPPGKIVSGEIILEGKDLLKFKEDDMAEIRGKKISMIFQEPLISLNPVMNVGMQIKETLENNLGYYGKEAEKEAMKLLEQVGLPDPFNFMKRYPHELSGGMAQRVLIAIAIAANPKLLIADEPTSSLDVTIQSQILELIKNLMKIGRISSVLFITHDLGVASQICDKIAVMYGGKIVEFGDIIKIFETPLHPYTIGLMKAIPKPGYYDRMYSIPGELPDLVSLPSGCIFHPRCPYAREVCKEVEPSHHEVEDSHIAVCHLVEKNRDV
ncbi:MAG: ABC transporter ATP-binding protein [Candidatus Bathyarchaeia archaeon]